MNLQQRYRSKLIYGVKRIHNSRAMGRGIGLFLMALLLICVNGCTMQSSKGPNNEVEDTRVTKDMVSGEGSKKEEQAGTKKKGKKNEETEQKSALTTQNRELSMSSYDGISHAYNSWWFKRNMDHLPSGAQEEIDIAKYNAVYVSNKAVQGKNIDKVIYLTFDCGYDNGYTETMLDILKKHKAPATFFVTQTYIRDSTDIVKRMKEEGHFVGNHSITHPNLSDAPLEKIEEEILGCQDYMKEATGYEMDLFFRPPKGEYSEYLLKVAQDLGYKTVFWSMAYLDYDVNNQPSVDHVVEHWQKYYHPGAIPLIHNVSSANAAALETILTNLEKEGYRFGSLDEL